MSASSAEGAASALRILMATPHFHPSVGGVETHVHEVSARLARMGASVTVLATDRTGELPEEEDHGGVDTRRVRAWPRRADYLFAPGMREVVSSGGWDVVHVQSYHTLVAPTAMLSARRAGVPYVVTFHAGGHSSPIRGHVRGLQLRTLRPLLAGASRLVALTKFEVERYGQLLRLDPSRFVQIPNGCDLPVPRVPEGGPERWWNARALCGPARALQGPPASYRSASSPAPAAARRATSRRRHRPL